MAAATGPTLASALATTEDRVRGLVAEMRADDPDPTDPFRGLYLTPERVARILDTGGPGTAASDRLAGTAARAGLDGLDVALLMATVAPDVDPRFEQLYGYLNDDVTRRRASVALALRVAGADPADPRARARLAPGAPLRSTGLVVVEDPDRPLLTRALRAPDRVVAYLLGGAASDTGSVGEAGRDSDVPYLDVDPWPADPVAHAGLCRAVVDDPTANRSGAPSRLLVVETAPGCARAAVRAAAAETGREVLDVPLDLPGVERGTVAAAALDAVLTGAVLVVGLLDAPGADVAALDPLTRHPGTVVFVASRGWDPSWPGPVPATLAVDAPAPAERERLLTAGLRGRDDQVDGQDHDREDDDRDEAGLLPDRDGTGTPEAISRLAGPLRAGPEALRTVAALAADQARIEGSRVTGAHLRGGVRAVNGTALDGLTRHVEPGVTWDDLVLPGDALTGLRQVCLRARYRDTVLGDWRMRPGGGRGRGVVALFAGDSGTGKTMSAEVVAADLGLDLYVVDLSTLVDKYVGETEKNLERVFTAATGMSAVLLFDEADAVFGKRSEVKDAHDRYANVESAYLLQRIERFDGIALLTTNLRANVDEAFTRRLDVVVDFPFPEAGEREQLWDRCLGSGVPRAGDLDLRALAERFDLAGGSIRACAVAAAYAAAARDGVVRMADLTEAVRQEYRKQGRLLGRASFDGLG